MRLSDYSPNPNSQAVLTSLWDAAFFAFDASFLLECHFYREEAFEEVLQILRELRGRIWVPHHVACEYATNSVTLLGAYLQDLSEWKHASTSIKAPLRKTAVAKHVHLFDAASLRTYIDKAVQDFTNEATQAQNRARELLSPSSKTFQQRRAELDAVFEDAIGPRLSDERLKEIAESGPARYALKTPPGWRDQDKPGHRFGDLVIWNEILDRAQSQGRPFVFVTEDRKEDWFADAAQSVPQPVLMLEAQQRGVRGHVVTASDFIQFAGPRVGKQAQESTVAEIKDTTARRSTTVSLTSFMKKIEGQSKYIEALADKQRLFHQIAFGALPSIDSQLALLAGSPELAEVAANFGMLGYDSPAAAILSNYPTLSIDQIRFLTGALTEPAGNSLDDSDEQNLEDDEDQTEPQDE